jgi:tetratricopeptide (TPR) repeat protein
MHDDLLAQLAAHRRTLAQQREQRAKFGAGHVPPQIDHTIAEACAAIAQLKAQLRAAGVDVDDAPGDSQAPAGGGTDLAARAVARLAALPEDTLPAPAPLPAPHRMPLRPNDSFVGRAHELTTIAAALKAGRATAITTGIGGAGKTQLAAEFVHRYGQFFLGGVFWISFADPAGIATEIAACGGAGALELYTDAAGLTLAEQVARVRQAWAAPLPRLLVFDNCDDLPGRTAEQLLSEYLPHGGGCRVLVTSRRGQWHRSPALLQYRLDTLPRDESIALLRGYRPDLGAADAAALAELLGDLPLALSLAGSYLEYYADEAFGAPGEYLSTLQRQLLGHRSLQGAGAGPSLTSHEQNVRATFQLSYDRLDRADPTDTLAIAALARAACFAPGEAFPRTLLLATLGAASDDDASADALHRLVALGLLEPAADASLRIHQLVSAFAHATVADAAAQPDAEAALTDEANRRVNAGYPARLLPILAHARHAQARADARADAQAAALANALARAEEALMNYAAARPLYERALAIREQARGPAHPTTASSLNNLAALLYAQGDFAAARPYLERALAIREQALGPAHPSTATSLNNLAGLLYAQGDFAAARPYLERALAIHEQALGPTHPTTASSLNNLALLLYAQGDFTAARPYLERALAITEQALGPAHPDTAQSLNNLALLLKAQGDFAAARPLYERALAITEQALGPGHPTTATIRANLAALNAQAAPGGDHRPPTTE